MTNLFEQYYPSVSEEEYSSCDRIESEVGSLLYRPVSSTAAHICGLVIHPDYRGQGRARELLLLLQQEYSTLTANVLFTEVNRLPFWFHLGFQVSETNSAAGYIQLKWSTSIVREPMIDPSLLS